MNMQSVRERAVAAGLTRTGKLRKSELVHNIQLAEGNTPCFGADWRQQCPEMKCCWRTDCLKG
jgi:hypothetical protein